MALRFKTDLKWSDVTPKSVFMNRRQVIVSGGAALLGMAGGSLAAAEGGGKLNAAPSRYSTDETQNTFEEISGYNNYYEFGLDKGDPAKNAHRLTTDPWAVQIDGLVDRPGSYDLADILKGQALEQRIYRHRCVEAWSMVVPWVGFELNNLLARAGVQPQAKFVSFETLVRPGEMPMQSTKILDWPYREGLRLDEAMHPLTILATGLYDEVMPKQNGAPLRLVVPWKYGFKSIKSIVRISLTEEQPQATWNMQAPREYGFYSNVNPTVDHPRWSQTSERRIGAGFFAKRQPTLMFNGYGDEVASLYTGMDLTKQF